MRKIKLFEQFKIFPRLRISANLLKSLNRIIVLVYTQIYVRFLKYLHLLFHEREFLLPQFNLSILKQLLDRFVHQKL